ncbi:DUF2341 domain-containing protein [Chloroflexus sp.]|uniref:DUF2341 domain-containing protein n=1 Tax=Chloroflexus sp. TaxID=1904827 RepID=UPI00262A6B53|nr:DUF2341 domain-containing protein [uncultured Chloroflexus sp.]
MTAFHLLRYLAAGALVFGWWVSLFLRSPAARAATAHYVAPNGADTNPGTLTQPFRTIQKCASVAAAGDTCDIRAGVYRETVRPAASGVTGAPITFQPYQNERVVISGADVITGPWTLHSGAIYRATVPWSLNVRTPNQVTDNQVWVDGMMMPVARWPNIPIDRVTRLANADKARADSAEVIDQYNAIYYDADLAGFADNAWAGARITFGPGYNWNTATCDVVASSASARSARLQCNPDPAAFGTRTDLSGWARPQGGNYYYLWGKLMALDAPGEWFYNESDQSLYLWLPNSAAPTAHTIEMKRRLWAFDLTDRSHIVLDGLNIFAATIRTNAQSHHLLLQRLDMRFLWHFQQLLPMFWTNGTFGIDLAGNDNVLRDSVLAYSAAELLRLTGQRNLAYNNVLRDAGYAGGAVGVTGRATGQSNPGGADSNHLFQNTIFNVARSAVDLGPGFNVTHNDIYQSHLQVTDGGSVNGWGLDGKGSVVAYNWVHDNWAELDLNLKYYGGHGIYLDDDTYNFYVYRNIVWNTTSPGIFTYGVNGTIVTSMAGAPANRFVYNNTVDGEIKADAKSNLNGLPQNLTGTVFINNIGAKLGLSHPQLTVDRNFAGDAVFADRATRNYALRPYSSAVDAGVDLGSPFMDPPAQPINAPDQGALEHGRTPWVAGALIRPQDLPALEVSCQIQADGVTALCAIENLPPGRKLPLDFALRIGSGLPSSACVNHADYTTHRVAGECVVSAAGLTTTQPVAIRLGNGDWYTTTASVSPQPLTLLSVNPSTTWTSGGAQLTLTGHRFATGETGWKREITIANTSGAPLFNYPVAITLDTASLIADGKLRADCGDLRWHDEAGSLDYWLERGCGTSATRVWVKIPYLPVGSRDITLTYGNALRASASNGQRVFAFFDDFSDGVLAPHWSTPGGSSYTITETGGQLRLSGQTNATNQYQPATFFLQMWMLNLPSDLAIDTTLSIVTGPASFKAGLGSDLNLVGMSASGKNIAYWASGWNVVSASAITGGVVSDYEFSMGVSGSPLRTIRWREGGDLNTVRATWSTLTPTLGMFSYAPDAVATFDVRFDNIRIRPFAFPEPTASVGAEQTTGVRVLIDGAPCANVTVIDSTRLTCTAPAHPAGPVTVTVINPDNASSSLSNALLYIEAPPNRIFVPVVQRSAS